MKVPRPPALLVLAVLALHLLLGQEVQRIHDGWVSQGPPPMPARMKVDFVREMVMKPPPVVLVAPHSPPPARPERASKPEAVQETAQAASAPEPAPPPAPPPASSPEAVADAASSPAETAPPVASVASAASAATDGEPGPEWPLSTRLSYVLTGHYRGPVSGQAQVEWLRKGSDYQIHLDVGIGPSFAPLITRRMSSQGQLTPGGIAPLRYDEETKFIFGEPRRLSLSFLGGDVPIPSGAPRSARRGAQDSVSQFVQLTWLFLTGLEPQEVGRLVQFPVLLASGPYDWKYESMGEEVLDTPMGPLAAWHLKPRQAARGGDLIADVWLAPTLQYLPVRLLIRQDADTYIDLMLKSAPLQAAPESTGIPRRLSQ